MAIYSYLHEKRYCSENSANLKHILQFCFFGMNRCSINGKPPAWEKLLKRKFNYTLAKLREQSYTHNPKVSHWNINILTVLTSIPDIMDATLFLLSPTSTHPSTLGNWTLSKHPAMFILNFAKVFLFIPCNSLRLRLFVNLQVVRSVYNFKVILIL